MDAKRCPGGFRKVGNKCIPKKRTITIEIKDGSIHDVSGMPRDIRVKFIDHDWPDGKHVYYWNEKK